MEYLTIEENIKTHIKDIKQINKNYDKIILNSYEIMIKNEKMFNTAKDQNMHKSYNNLCLKHNIINKYLN